jgi:hypothetical protein
MHGPMDALWLQPPARLAIWCVRLASLQRALCPGFEAALQDALGRDRALRVWCAGQVLALAGARAPQRPTQSPFATGISFEEEILLEGLYAAQSADDARRHRCARAYAPAMPIVAAKAMTEIAAGFTAAGFEFDAPLGHVRATRAPLTSAKP